MTNIVLPECSTHPTYKAVHKPRSGCSACWVKYLAKREVNRIERERYDRDFRHNDIEY